MGFTSGKRALLGLPLANHDDMPHVDDHGVRHAEAFDWDGELMTCAGCVTRYKPRPRFDVPDNPILAIFRDRQYSESSYGKTPLQFEGWLFRDARYYVDNFGEEQYYHARRVISKLVALT